MYTWRVANREYTQSDSQGAAPGAKCDVYECFVVEEISTAGCLTMTNTAVYINRVQLNNC